MRSEFFPTRFLRHNMAAHRNPTANHHVPKATKVNALHHPDDQYLICKQKDVIDQEMIMEAATEHTTERHVFEGVLAPLS